MAKFTHTIMVRGDWIAISTVEDTVLVQRISAPEMELFVADEAPGDDDVGQVLAAGALKTAGWAGLNGGGVSRGIWARAKNLATADAVEVRVTMF